VSKTRVHNLINGSHAGKPKRCPLNMKTVLQAQQSTE